MCLIVKGILADLNVVVEFPSLEKAMECKNSTEYKAIEAGRKENDWYVYCYRGCVNKWKIPNST